MVTITFSSIIVPELLTNDNYANWNAWMENYLLAQDLWHVVEGTAEPEDDVVELKAWRKNNAAALYAILISCGEDILPEIREIRSAKIVWDKLARMNRPDSSDNSSNNSSDSSSDSSSDNLGPELDSTSDSLAASSINSDYEPLCTAINNGDWDAANDFLTREEEAKTARITVNGRTALHLAVFVGKTTMVENLVESMSEDGLEIQDDYGLTALAQAVILQNIRMVECMLTKNNHLLYIRDKSDRIPLVAALDYGHIDMAHHLYFPSLQHQTESQTLTDIDASTVLTQFIRLNKFDLALDLLQCYPRAAIVPNKYDTSPLFALASKSSAFPSGNQLMFWAKWIYADIHNPNEHQCDQVGITESVLGLFRRLALNLLKLLGIKKNFYEINELHHQASQLLVQMCSQIKQMNGDYVIEAILQAVRGGIVEFIDEIVKVEPRILYTTDTMGRNIFFYAVLYRQPKIFRLIYDLDVKSLITNALDSSGSTILHMAGMLEHSIERDHITGAALKMQNELQWFKEVKRICLPFIHEIRNYENVTAKELFTHNHKDMLKEGEKWIKGIATSCTVVGTLIITIMFTAAFTVPGGNNQTYGYPIFSDTKLFKVFIIFDTLSLFFASTSILVFLGIVTSRYAEDDFYQSLPLKMIIGHFTLFLSIATMLTAFCAGFFLVVHEKLWMVIPAICLASVIVIHFAYMLFPLLVYMLKKVSKYGVRTRHLPCLF